MPKFIFTADWHIRPDRPICRIDEDWIETQEEQLYFITQQCAKYNCPLIIGGDIFHIPQVSDKLKNMVMDYILRQETYVIAGNHDLPYHSWKNVSESSFGVLFKSGVIKDLLDFGAFAHFGNNMAGYKDEIVFIHESIFASASDCPPNMKAKTAEEILEEYPDAKWILCGDIHRSFHYKKRDRHVIMAGCLNRQAADYKDYTPVIWFIDTDNNIVEKIEVPDDANMLTDNHIKARDEKEERIVAFVELIRNSKEISLDFVENVKKALLENIDVDQDIVDIVNKLMED